MTWPAGLPTRQCSLGPDFGLVTGADYGVDIDVTISRPYMVWGATGAGAIGDKQTITIEPGQEQTFPLVVTDATGWYVGGIPVDVSGGKQSHTYNLTIRPWLYDSRNAKKYTNATVSLPGLVIPSGDTVLDLDKSVTTGGAQGSTVTIPDFLASLRAEVDQYKAELEAVAAAPTDEFVAGRIDDETSKTAIALKSAVDDRIATQVPGIIAAEPTVVDAAQTAVEGALAGAVNVQAVACFGDSMFGDQGNIGVTVPSLLSTNLLRPVFAGGVNGQTSTEIALRQGGLDVIVNVAGNTIPASGSVAVTVLTPTGTWKTGTAWTFSGLLAGVPGTLAKATDDTWTFTRQTAGNAVTVTPEIRWTSTYNNYNNRVTVVRSGRNNSTDPSIVLRDDKAIRSGLAGTNNRLLVLSTYNTANEVSGSAGYNNIMAINAALQAEFGANYYDLRGWLIRNGLTLAGITPTAQDATDIANDCIPQSLRLSGDSTHLNATGRQLEADQIARVLIAKGWISKPTVLTVSNYVSNPRMGNATTDWSVAGGGGTGTVTRQATGGPLPECPTYGRAVWSVPPTGSAQVRVDNPGKILVTAGNTYTLKAFARGSWAGSVAISAGSYNGSTFVAASVGSYTTLTPNQWIELPAVTFTAATGSTRVRPSVQLQAGSTMPTTSDTLDVTAFFLYDGGELIGIAYRDGDMAGFHWLGTPHDSVSTGTIQIG